MVTDPWDSLSVDRGACHSLQQRRQQALLAAEMPLVYPATTCPKDGGRGEEEREEGEGGEEEGAHLNTSIQVLGDRGSISKSWGLNLNPQCPWKAGDSRIHLQSSILQRDGRQRQENPHECVDQVAWCMWQLAAKRPHLKVEGKD